jgi:hypothetical protein
MCSDAIHSRRLKHKEGHGQGAGWKPVAFPCGPPNAGLSAARGDVVCRRMHGCTPVAALRGESAGGQRRSPPSPGWGSRSRHRDGSVEREREALCASWRKEYIVGGWTFLGKTNARRLPGGGTGKRLRRGILIRLCTGPFGRALRATYLSCWEIFHAR